MGDTIKTKKRSIPIQAQRLEQWMNEPSKANVCVSPDISILFHDHVFLYSWRSWSITKKIGFSFTGHLEKFWVLTLSHDDKDDGDYNHFSPRNVFVFRTKNSLWRDRIEPIFLVQSLKGMFPWNKIPSSKILSQNCSWPLCTPRLLSGTCLCAPDCRQLATCRQTVELLKAQSMLNEPSPRWKPHLFPKLDPNNTLFLQTSVLPRWKLAKNTLYGIPI